MEVFFFLSNPSRKYNTKRSAEIQLSRKKNDAKNLPGTQTDIINIESSVDSDWQVSHGLPSTGAQSSCIPSLLKSCFHRRQLCFVGLFYLLMWVPLQTPVPGHHSSEGFPRLDLSQFSLNLFVSSNRHISLKLWLSVSHQPEA